MVPLALLLTAPSLAAPSLAGAVDGPVAVRPGITAREAFRATAEYRERALGIHEVRERVGDGPSGPIHQVTWTVRMGPHALTVPAFHHLARSPEGAELAIRLRQSRQRSLAWGGLALAGAAATAGVGVGLSNSTGTPAADDWRLALSGTLAATVTGIAGSLVSSGRTHRLRHDFPLTVSRRDAHRTVDRYNAALREELGLDLAEAAGPPQ